MKESDDVKAEKEVEKERCRQCGKLADDEGLCPNCGRCSECCECAEF